MSENNQNRSERRKTRSPGAKINKICIAVVLVLFAAVFLLNLFQFNRPTVSESEKRTLATWPEFSWKSLGDGSYFSGISDFIKDTFWQRDTLINFSSKLDSVKGFDYEVNGVKYVVIGKDTQESTAETTEYRSIFEDFTFPPDDTVGTSSPESTTAVPTDTGTSDSTAPGQTATPVTTQEIPFAYVSLSLSKAAAEMKSDEALVLTADLQTVGNGTADPITWTASDKNKIILTPAADGLSATVMGVAEGSVTVTAQVGSLSAQCVITVKKATSTGGDPNLKEIEGSVFMYGDSFYQAVNYRGTSLTNIAKDYSTLCAYYSRVFNGAPVSFLAAPHAVIKLDTAKVPKAGRDQGLILQDMDDVFPDTVNFVNCYTAIKTHASEYIYFKTDHHWTALGAYYAYTAFAESKGFTPTPLSAFAKNVNTETYQGSYKSYFQDNHIEGLYDSIVTYQPTKAHTMTVHYTPSDAKQVGSATRTFNTCVFSGTKSYLAFLSGDRPMVEIHVPENGADGNGKTILVLHDSYGSAMIPYLCEHYENIIAIDPRYFNLTYPNQTVQEVLKKVQIDDILFLQNIQMANSTNWLNNYWAKLVGLK